LYFGLFNPSTVGAVEGFFNILNYLSSPYGGGNALEC
jgi:hypothetical protein